MKKIDRVLLVGILVVAGILRFVGTNPGYNKYHSDEGISYSAAVSMIKNKSLDPLRYDYPAVTPLVNYITFRTVFIPIAWEKYYLTHLGEIIDGKLKLPLDSESYRRVFQTMILGEREVNAIFWGRYTTALISLGSVWLVFILGKKLFGKWVGFLAAIFLTVNFRSVTNAHIGLPDTYNAFFLLLSLVLSAQLFEKREKRDYLLAGVGMGLSMAVKYQFFSVFSFFLAHFLWSGESMRKKFLNPNMFLALVMAIFVFILINPYALIKLEETLGWLSLINIKYAMGRKILNVYAISYLYHIAIGALASSLMVWGFSYTVLKKWREMIFLMGFVGPFMYMTLYYSNGGFYVRNFVTVMPLLMVWVGVGFVALTCLVKPKVVRIFLAGIILPIILWSSVKNSIINSYYYTKPWNYDAILVEAKENLSEGDLVAAHPFDPLPSYVSRLPFVTEERYSVAEFRQENIDYALINMDWAANNFYGWMNTTFEESLKYWEKPYEVMRNTFWGISVEEMMRCVVASAYKPWQAPEADLFLIKVPNYSELNFEDKGTLLNSAFEVDGGYVYRIVAKVFSESEVNLRQRNVYVRLSLYTTNNKIVSVSPRYWGQGEQDLEFYVFVPKGTYFGEIQMEASGTTGIKYELVEVVAYRSTERYEDQEGCKEVEYDEYKDLLYPYSHGNL